VVAHEIGVLGEVDGLEGQAAEALPPVDGLILRGGGAAAAGLGAPLAIHGGVRSVWLADGSGRSLVTTMSAKSNRAQFAVAARDNPNSAQSYLEEFVKNRLV
jgi:hypothetical protein